MSSRNFGEALKVAERYIHVFNDAVDIQLISQRDAITLEFQLTDTSAKSRRQATEFGMAGLVRSARFLANKELRPVEVSFMHPRNHETARFEKFFGCQVHFGTRHNSITFSRRQAALPIAKADKRLLGILTGYCDEILANRELNSPDLRHQVERVIGRLLSRGEAQTEIAAHELGMGVRTLARRLNGLGVTFAQILDEFRHDLARTYLRDPTLTLSQVTFLLGYSDLSAFSHAFRRWTGTTPGSWRAKNAR